jgi:hypothetical protein
MHERKDQLERDADPVLYNYKTNPALAAEYAKVWEYAEPGPRGGTFKYEDGIYEKLRARYPNYRVRLASGLSAHPDRVPLTLLFLFEGDQGHIGFQWFNSFMLFIFNVICDFVSATIAIVSVRALGRFHFFCRAIIVFVCATGGTLFCFVVAFLSYRIFFGGVTDFFGIMFTTLASLYFLIIGTSLIFPKILYSSKEKWGSRLEIALGFIAAMLGVMAFYYAASEFRQSQGVGFISWHDIFQVPYILAATTLVPAMIVLVTFGLVLIAKATVEPARVLPETYMTYVKEELSGTQASGLILILAIIAGAIAGLIWGTP